MRLILIAVASLFFLARGDTTATAAEEDGGQVSSRRLSHLANKRIKESSGLACSRRVEGVFWTHNDSGDEPRIYAFDRRGRDLGDFRVPGARARGWEDMASFTLDGSPCLLMGDVGDNTLQADAYQLYLIEEPKLGEKGGCHDRTARLLQQVSYRYDDGPHNCEAIGFDVQRRVVLLITKDSGSSCGVYRLPWPRSRDAGDPLQVAHRIGEAHVPFVTAMDIAPEGKRAVVCTYLQAFEFDRRPQQDWAAAFRQGGRSILVPFRRQGESICYGRDGTTIYLTSEKRPTPLFELRRPG